MNNLKGIISINFRTISPGLFTSRGWCSYKGSAGEAVNDKLIAFTIGIFLNSSGQYMIVEGGVI